MTTRGRPRTSSLQDILDAIFCGLRTGCPWRYLPANFPPLQTDFYHFRRWRLQGLRFRLHCALHGAERERVGRETDPNAAILDAPGVKTVEESACISGYNGHTCLKGRKRHLLVDTLGLPIACNVTQSDLSDPAGARKFLADLAFRVPRLKKIWAVEMRSSISLRMRRREARAAPSVACPDVTSNARQRRLRSQAATPESMYEVNEQGVLADTGERRNSTGHLL